MSMAWRARPDGRACVLPRQAGLSFAPDPRVVRRAACCPARRASALCTYPTGWSAAGPAWTSESGSATRFDSYPGSHDLMGMPRSDTPRGMRKVFLCRLGSPNAWCSASSSVVPLRAATRAWFLVSLQTFGGPAGQIAVMQRMLVEERRWIGQQRFLHALSFCTLLPGPGGPAARHLHRLAAQRHPRRPDRRRAVRPARASSRCSRSRRSTSGTATPPSSRRCSSGSAPRSSRSSSRRVLRVGRRALTAPWLVALAVGSFVALAFFAVPFPVVDRGRGSGRLAGRSLGAAARWPPRPGRGDLGAAPLISRRRRCTGAARRAAHTLLVLAVGHRCCGSRRCWRPPRSPARDSVFVEQGMFFSGAAVVTFGGAYAVLGLRRAAGGQHLPLAHRQRDGPRPGPGRDAPPGR